MPKRLHQALLAGCAAVFLSVATTGDASAQTYSSGQSATSGQVVKRVFRLGARGWRILSLSATVGMSAVEAHARGYDASQTAGKIAEDIAEEVVTTIGDVAYVGRYIAIHSGRGALSLLAWLAD